MSFLDRISERLKEEPKTSTSLKNLKEKIKADETLLIHQPNPTDIEPLEDLIYQHIPELSHRSNGSGFHPVLCKVCNDKGHKGKRAGFKFDADGSVGYNCFNCGAVAKYNPLENKTISRSMREILDAFGVPKEDYMKLAFNNAKASGNYERSEDSDEQPIKRINKPTAIELNINCIDIDRSLIEHVAYLESRRVPWESLGLKVCIDEGPWFNRIIIPIYYNNKLIFYQGRQIDNSSKRKYLKPEGNFSNVISNMDHLHDDVDYPVFITEGWMDSILINGFCVFSNKLSADQISWLNTTKREKICIPDRNISGTKLAEQCLEQGWSIALPDFGSSKDLNECAIDRGLVWVMYTIRNNIFRGDVGRMKLKAWAL